MAAAPNRQRAGRALGAAGTKSGQNDPRSANLPQSETERRRRMFMALAYYYGNPPRPLTIRLAGVDDNILINFAKLVVDTGVSFLFGRGVEVQVTDYTTAAKSTDRTNLPPTKKAPTLGPDGEPTNKYQGEQDWLDLAWRANNRDITLQKFAVNGGITGEAFMKIVPDEPYPRLIVLDPTQVGTKCVDGDIDTIVLFTIGGQDIQAPGGVGVNVLQDKHQDLDRQIIQDTGYKVGMFKGDWEPKWVIIDQRKIQGEWVDSGQPTLWEYPWPPIVYCQNMPMPNDFWGDSDLSTGVLHIMNAINRNASHYSKIIRLHAHPKFWARGIGKQNLDVGIDSVLNLQGNDAAMGLLEMQNDLMSTRELIKLLVEYMSYLTQTPLIAMGLPDGLGAPSGISLQIRYMPILSKTEVKRQTYGNAIIDISKRMLEMAGKGHDDTEITLQWPEMLPSDPMALRTVLQADLSMGIVSKHTVAQKLGYEYDQERILQHTEETDDAEKQGQVAGVAQTAINKHVPPPNPVPTNPDTGKTPGVVKPGGGPANQSPAAPVAPPKGASK